MKQILIISLCSAVFGCQTSETKPPEFVQSDGITITLTDAQFTNAALQSDTLMYKDLLGQLRLNGVIDVPPQNLASISAPLGGYVKRTKLLPGMPVKKGEVIAVLEDQQYIQLQQDYLVKQADLKLAEAEFNRQQQLNATQASSNKNLEQAEAHFVSSRATIHALAVKLKLIHIDPKSVSYNNISSTIHVYAPFTGFVSKVNVNVGKYVSPSDILFELVNPDDIHLNLKVFENDLPLLQQGQRLEAFTNANPAKRFPCSILLISRLIPEEKTAEVHCHFNQYDHDLVPGMFMSADVAISRRHVAVLPAEAIVQFEGKSYVFITKTPRTFQMTGITTGETNNGFTEIIDWPIIDGKEVATKGAYTLLMALKNVAEE